RRRHTRSYGDWSSDVCSSDLFIRLFFRIIAARFHNSAQHSPRYTTSSAALIGTMLRDFYKAGGDQRLSRMQSQRFNHQTNLSAYDLSLRQAACEMARKYPSESAKTSSCYARSKFPAWFEGIATATQSAER